MPRRQTHGQTGELTAEAANVIHRKVNGVLAEFSDSVQVEYAPQLSHTFIVFTLLETASFGSVIS